MKARGRQVIMSCNTANYHKLYRIVDFRYRPPFLWEMKNKDRYFVAFYKLLVKSLKTEKGIYIYIYIYIEREREREWALCYVRTSTCFEALFIPVRVIRT